MPQAPPTPPPTLLYIADERLLVLKTFLSAPSLLFGARSFSSACCHRLFALPLDSYSSTRIVVDCQCQPFDLQMLIS